MPKTTKICLHPKCDLSAMARGLCRIHYAQAKRAVRAGATSWEKLVKKGKAIAKRPPSWFRT